MDIRLLVLDVDGTLTDSAIYYGDNNIEIKAFSTKDGAALKPLSNLGIDVIFMTGHESAAVARRADDLKARAIQNISDKATELHKIFKEMGINTEQTAYIGDDLNDFAAMRMCGLKASPVDATPEIKAICNYVSPYRGGHGAVRDICEYILRHEGKYDAFLDYYGVKN